MKTLLLSDVFKTNEQAQNIKEASAQVKLANQEMLNAMQAFAELPSEDSYQKVIRKMDAFRRQTLKFHAVCVRELHGKWE